MRISGFADLTKPPAEVARPGARILHTGGVERSHPKGASARSRRAAAGRGGAGRSLLRRSLARLAGGDPAAFGAVLAALVLAGTANLAAGLILASSTGALERLPGLLLLVPAAIALRGNIFGALGSRLGTAIHTGTFRLTPRLDSVMGQNAAASMALSLMLGVALAGLAKAMAVVFNLSPTMSLADFVAISTVGGLLASAVVLVITLAVTGGAVRLGLDLDNVAVPLVSAAADVVTLPALVVAAELAGMPVATPALAWSLAALAALTGLWAARTRLEALRRVVKESVPVLLVAGLLDLGAGITVEKRLGAFLAFPVLLVLLPGYLSTAGALGGVLSSRLSTKLHLGLIRPAPFPAGPARGDIATIFALSVPVFALLGLMASAGAAVTGRASPGLADLVGVAVIGGLMATVVVMAVAYYATLAAVRFGLDPDTHGIPMVMSSLDFVGVFTLILVVVWLGVA